MFLLPFLRKYWLVLFIVLFLSVVPFFWLKSGEMDLGGDSSRLYFYDPITFIKSTAIYNISTQGKGLVEPNYYFLPYVIFLAILKLITSSSTSVIAISNGLKLAGGFIGIFLIIRELLLRSRSVINKRLIYLASMLSGVFYIVAFNSIHMSYTWDRAIMSHNQVFLNPIIFFLFLKFLLTSNYKYMVIGLLVSFVFSSNFGLTSAPPFFAFYPLSFLFLFLYVGMFGEKPIPWKRVAVAIALFFGIHAFQMFPQVISLFDKDSFSNSKVFSKEEIEAGGVAYFSSVAPHGKAILSLLLPSVKQFFHWASLVAPFTIIIGFLLNKKREKDFLLISLFFIITFFLVTANITHIGFEFYKNLFYIPGFSMFRVFFNQWLFVFIFFYAISLGFSAYYILLRLKPFYSKLACCLMFVLLVLPGIPLFMGTPVNKSVIRGSNNVRGIIEIDPHYEETLRYIHTLPNDGKILVLPLTDYFRQVVYGSSGGAYEGPSTLLHLTDKYSFVGYQHFGYKNGMPYAEDIMRYSREKNYDRLFRIFSVLNIRYVFHNSDPKVYEESFSPGSYGYMQTSMPKNQKEYIEFIKNFPLTQIYKNGQYVIYEVDKALYNSTIFVPEGVYESNQLSFDEDKNKSVFIDSKTCNNPKFKSLCNGKYRKANVDIQMSMINPTLYKIDVHQNGSVDSMLLVMQHTFHSGWKLMLNNKYIVEDSHIMVNGYANGWIISAKDIPMKKDHVLYVKLDPQKYFRYCLYVSSAFLIIVILFIILPFKGKHEKN